jgi:hypothetical protein
VVLENSLKKVQVVIAQSGKGTLPRSQRSILSVMLEHSSLRRLSFSSPDVGALHGRGKVGV